MLHRKSTSESKDYLPPNDDVHVNRRSYLQLTGTAIAAAGLLSETATAESPQAELTAGAYRVNGSYPGWGWWSGYHPSDIPFELLDFVDISDFTPEEDGTVQFSYPSIEHDVLTAFRNADRGETKVVAKIGGWTGSEQFSNAALTEERRQRFADTTIEYLREYDLDGAEINWEFPLGNGASGNVERDEDPQNWIALLSLLRERFDEAGAEDGQHYWLTVSASNHPWRAREHDLERLAELVDYAKLQGYHISGNWSSETNHHSALYSSVDDEYHNYTPSCHYVIQTWIDEGFPPEKINLGVPAFATLFEGVAATEMNGLAQPFDTQNGYPEYSDIVSTYLTDSEYTLYWDEVGKVPWLYSPTHEEFISYDDVQSLQRKCEYVAERGLHGIQLWQLMADTDEHGLLQAAYEMREDHGTVSDPAEDEPEEEESEEEEEEPEEEESEEEEEEPEEEESEEEEEEPEEDESVADGEEEDEGVTVPEIDYLRLRNRSNPAWARVRVSWSVSDVGGDLDDVSVRLVAKDSGSVVDSTTASISGSTASSSCGLRKKRAHGEYAVELTVSTDSGSHTSARKSITLD